MPSFRSKLKIALDFSNGSSGPEFVLVLEKLKIDFATLNETPNGKFRHIARTRFYPKAKGNKNTNEAE